MITLFNNIELLKAAIFLIIISIIQSCASVSTFPTIARAGDTVSIMIGGSEKANKTSISVILEDSSGLNWNLTDLGLVRSVFNLRTEGRAVGNHYSTYLESYISWENGHEPVQTVLVIDIPDGVSNGYATLNIDTNVDDDSSGISLPYTVNVEIVPGVGSSDQFLRQSFVGNQYDVDFSRLEPAPHAKITYGVDAAQKIGAVSLVVDFDETVVNPDDLNVYVPQSNVRGDFLSNGAFGDKQRMVYWRHDNQKLFLDIVAPQGIDMTYLLAYIMHPPGVVGNPNFTLVSSKTYDVAGNELPVLPVLEYSP